MSYCERHTVVIAVDAAGDGTGYTPVVTGKLSQIRYAKTDYANGVDFVITNETTGEILWDEDNVNASKTVAPRQATHDNTGTAALYAAAGTAVLDKIGLANDRVKIVVAQGGVSTTGTFHVFIE